MKDEKIKNNIFTESDKKMNRIIQTNGSGRLTENYIINLIRIYKEKHGCFPSAKSGKIDGANEYWLSLNNSLINKSLRITKKSSLAKLMEENFTEYINHNNKC